jgi:hypothetical protein
MSTHIAPAPIMDTTSERALALLGAGIAPAAAAASLGVSESRISQLLSDDTFAAKVAELRFQNLQKHNARDASYDTLEDELLEKMRDCIPLMHRPMEILKAISIINAAKRRGQSAPDSILEKQTIINLQIPVQIINKFTTNLEGQVTSIGDQSLLTIQSGSLSTLATKRKEHRNEAALPAPA